MTIDKKRKRLIRARMAQTGESYTAAARALALPRAQLEQPTEEEKRAAPAHIRLGPKLVVKPGDLVLVRYGHDGTQVAKVISAGPNGVLARKWRDNSGGWTQPRPIPFTDVRGAPEANDPRLGRIAAWNERLLQAVGNEIVSGALPLPDPEEVGT